MKFGVREICDVVFKATATQKLGSRTFYKDEPVLYFDTLKTSSLDGAATTVYATGGRGNAQLVAWEGERTLTFVMEDALISAEGFAILSGADLIEATEAKPIIQHMTGTFEIAQKNTIDVGETVSQHKDAEVFVMALNEFNEIIGEPMVGKAEGSVITVEVDGECLAEGRYAFVDYYVERKAGAQQIEITPDKFGGYYYVEASTLFRREADGVDMPAEFVIPKAKVQSNFSFAMASSGDPSTFTFTLDAFPGYLKFDRSKQVLAAIQIIEDMEAGEGVDGGSRAENHCPEEDQPEQVSP